MNGSESYCNKNREKLNTNVFITKLPECFAGTTPSRGILGSG
jgi:hypothetical protein